MKKRPGIFFRFFFFTLFIQLVDNPSNYIPLGKKNKNVIPTKNLVKITVTKPTGHRILTLFLSFFLSKYDSYFVKNSA